MSEALSYRCPFCDCEVRVGKPCPGCPTQPEKTRRTKLKSWVRDAAADGLDLPDDDFDYDEFVAREFGRAPHRQLGVKWYWWLLGVTALAALIGGWLFR